MLSVQKTKLILSIKEVAEYLDISRTKVYQELRDGHIPHHRLGRRIVIPVAAFEEWLRSAFVGGQGLGEFVDDCPRPGMARTRPKTKTPT
jgi:excisionase family DNA binding protein